QEPSTGCRLLDLCGVSVHRCDDLRAHQCDQSHHNRGDDGPLQCRRAPLTIRVAHPLQKQVKCGGGDQRHRHRHHQGPCSCPCHLLTCVLMVCLPFVCVASTDVGTAVVGIARVMAPPSEPSQGRVEDEHDE